MGDAYYNLKTKLEEMGYNYILPVDAVPLVECMLADLLQTTRSLQHYMNLSKESLKQRDSVMMELEPYKCENSKLIRENCKIHKQFMELKEECDRISKESKRKIRALCDEISNKDCTITKLQHDLRDLSLRGICQDTLSSRNKMRKKDGSAVEQKVCTWDEKTSVDNTIELRKNMSALEEQIALYSDEITLLKNQVEHRDKEIVRLHILLEGGRPFNAIVDECCKMDPNTRTKELLSQIAELENINEFLKKEIDTGLEKQHEAMHRALTLADKNKLLNEELKKIETLALKVEEDCNQRLAEMLCEVNELKTKCEKLAQRNTYLEKELSLKEDKDSHKYQETLNSVFKEKEMLQMEVKELVELNKSLQDKIQSFLQSQMESERCPTKYELQRLLEEERKKYENHIVDIKSKLTENMNNFSKHLVTCKAADNKSRSKSSVNEDTHIMKHLRNKLCESEQKILMLRKEIEEYKNKISFETEGNKQNYKDIIAQLNVENAELSKENISLSQLLNQYKHLGKTKEENSEYLKEIQTLKEEIKSLTQEIQTLRKDKHEYNSRYKDSIYTIDKLKRDLAFKHKEIERLEEENCSFKMTNRTDRASTEHLKEECHFLREQIKKIQTDVIKEKTLANQIKNIQLETERSSSEIQSELLSVQKQLHLSKDTIQTLEKKCQDLQSENISLKHEKSSLIDNIRKVDLERDKLVIELDHKAEALSVLEQKLKSQSHEITRLENNLSDVKRKLSMTKIAEHKLSDNEAQIEFLNGEILRLQQKLDSAMMENKHLQNSLADTNGTLKLTKLEYEKSRKEVDGLKSQLQHYVAEIRRIEELLSQKEAERSDMLEHFASLSVEANILENTNHSLESESQSKSQQLQSYINKIQTLESKIIEKDSIIESQSLSIANLTCKVTSLENEIKLMTEEKNVLQQNVSYLKKMCNNLNIQNEKVSVGVCETDSELILYETKIRHLTAGKEKLQQEKNDLMEKLKTTENLLKNARTEVVDLKLALQDATSEAKLLQRRINSFRMEEAEMHEAHLATDELELPLMLEDPLHEVSQEDDEISTHFQDVHKRYSKYSHSSTL